MASKYVEYKKRRLQRLATEIERLKLLEVQLKMLEAEHQALLVTNEELRSESYYLKDELDRLKRRK